MVIDHGKVDIMENKLVEVNEINTSKNRTDLKRKMWSMRCGDVIAKENIISFYHGRRKWNKNFCIGNS